MTQHAKITGYGHGNLTENTLKSNPISLTGKGLSLRNNVSVESLLIQEINLDSIVMKFSNLNDLFVSVVKSTAFETVAKLPIVQSFFYATEHFILAGVYSEVLKTHKIRFVTDGTVNVEYKLPLSYSNCEVLGYSKPEYVDTVTATEFGAGSSVKITVVSSEVGEKYFYYADENGTQKCSNEEYVAVNVNCMIVPCVNSSTLGELRGIPIYHNV
jgi:hypothetical protein